MTLAAAFAVVLAAYYWRRRGNRRATGGLQASSDVPPRKSPLTVRAAAFDEPGLKDAVMSRMLDGQNDFLSFAWDIFGAKSTWSVFRADFGDLAAGVFMAFDMGRGSAFLNGLRTDGNLRRGGVATAIIRHIDVEMAKRGFTSIGMATVNTNTPMMTLCERKLGLVPVPFRMCQCGDRSDTRMRRAKLVEVPSERYKCLQSLKALTTFINASDYARCSKGLMMDVPGQFRALNAAEVEARLQARQVYAIGTMARLEALAIVGANWSGPNPCVCFVAGASVAATHEMLDELRCLVPADHPDGASAAEVCGYLPVGCAAYEAAANRTPLPSKLAWYCPRETLEMVMQWEAGTLPQA